MGGESIADVFRSVSGEIRRSWCGPCFGQGPDALERGERAITSFIRLEIKNESGMHGVTRGSETHLKVLVVSSAFGGVVPVDRHQRVNDLLQEELRTGMHALRLQALTPEEWEREPATFESSPASGDRKPTRHRNLRGGARGERASLGRPVT